MAWERDLWLTFGLSVLSSACLVTDKPQFGEPNSPASLRALTPKSTLIRASAAPDQRCATDKDSMFFQVAISDANIADSLTAVVYVDGIYQFQRAVPRTEEIVRDPLDVCLKRRDLLRKCTHVEVVVANEFGGLGAGDYQVTDPSDLAKVEWWVLPPPNDNPMATAGDCDRLFDGGL